MFIPRNLERGSDTQPRSDAAVSWAFTGWAAKFWASNDFDGIAGIAPTALNLLDIFTQYFTFFNDWDPGHIQVPELLHS
jgi:hypothetical protein